MGHKGRRGLETTPLGTEIKGTAQHSIAQHSTARCKILLWGARPAKGALLLLQWAAANTLEPVRTWCGSGWA